MRPVFCGEVVEAEQHIAVLDQLGDRLVVFHTICRDEVVKGGCGIRPRFSLPASRDIAAQCPVGQWILCR